jgi:hypothetical protein
MDGTDDTGTPIEATSSHTSTPRASYFPPGQMDVAAEASTRQPSPPLPELIPDIYPVAVRGCGPPSILGTREELPPRPFSTPPRIHSRAETATSMNTCVALSRYIRSGCCSTHAILVIIGTVYEKSCILSLLLKFRFSVFGLRFLSSSSSSSSLSSAGHPLALWPVTNRGF